MVDENVCSEDQDQLLILKASRIFVATSSLLLQKKTQCNIKGLKASENQTGRNGNITFTQPRRAHTCTMTSNATFAGAHGLKRTRGRSFPLMAQRTLLRSRYNILL